MMRVLVVGAGLSGAVIARELADVGIGSCVVDERPHIAGNCYTERDPATGVMVHKYGPHIFHTDNERVWSYVNKHARMQPYVNRVKANVGGRIYSLPINLHTINQFFSTAMSPSEAKRFITSKAVQGRPILSFEDQALAMVGPEIYQSFFKAYTEKQWGVSPTILPASILKRLPMRFTYDDNYFAHAYQGMPADGYTSLVESILRHPLIDVKTSCRFEDFGNLTDFSHLFYSGPMDRYFRYSRGRLSYRSLRFEKIQVEGDFQGTSVINYPDADIPFTRITEHKYFAPWEMEQFPCSVAMREYSIPCGLTDEPFYPVRLVDDTKTLRAYEDLCQSESGVTFVGRLGTYEYLDMDVAIERAFAAAAQFRQDLTDGKLERPT